MSALQSGASDRPGGQGKPTRLRVEVLVVLGVSLGASAVYAVLALADRLTEATPLASQTVALNTSDSVKPWLDLLYQLAGIGLGMVPAFLALYLLANATPGQASSQPAGQSRAQPVGPLAGGLRLVGLRPRRGLRDLGLGAALAAGIGLPGIAFYLLGRALGWTAHIETDGLGAHWWTIAVLILAAFKNGLVEEVVVVGYLSDRLTRLGWTPAAWIGAAAVLRGAYHLYQGVGPFFGNLAMGLAFGWFHHRVRRVGPLIAAHTLMDVVAFAGPALADPAWLT
jgi:membrane protease YdiL (CAAX protease family)